MGYVYVSHLCFGIRLINKFLHLSMWVALLFKAVSMNFCALLSKFLSQNSKLQSLKAAHTVSRYCPQEGQQIFTNCNILVVSKKKLSWTFLYILVCHRKLRKFTKANNFCKSVKIVWDTVTRRVHQLWRLYLLIWRPSRRSYLQRFPYTPVLMEIKKIYRKIQS